MLGRKITMKVFMKNTLLAIIGIVTINCIAMNEQASVKQLIEKIRMHDDHYFHAIDPHLSLDFLINSSWITKQASVYNNSVIAHIYTEFAKTDKAIKRYPVSGSHEVLIIEFYKEDNESKVIIQIQDKGIILPACFCDGRYWYFGLFEIVNVLNDNKARLELEAEIKHDIYRMFVLEMGIISRDWAGLAWQDKALAADLQELYAAFNTSEAEAQIKLDEFCTRWKLNAIKIADKATFGTI